MYGNPNVESILNLYLLDNARRTIKKFIWATQYWAFFIKDIKATFAYNCRIQIKFVWTRKTRYYVRFPKKYLFQMLVRSYRKTWTKNFNFELGQIKTQIQVIFGEWSNTSYIQFFFLSEILNLSFSSTCNQVKANCTFSSSDFSSFFFTLQDSFTKLLFSVCFSAPFSVWFSAPFFVCFSALFSVWFSAPFPSVFQLRFRHLYLFFL